MVNLMYLLQKKHVLHVIQVGKLDIRLRFMITQQVKKFPLLERLISQQLLKRQVQEGIFHSGEFGLPMKICYPEPSSPTLEIVDSASNAFRFNLDLR